MLPEWKETKEGDWTRKCSEQIEATIRRHHHDEKWLAEVRVTLPCLGSWAVIRFPRDTNRQLTVLATDTDVAIEEIRGAFSRIKSRAGVGDVVEEHDFGLGPHQIRNCTAINTATAHHPLQVQAEPGGERWEIEACPNGRGFNVQHYEGNEFKYVMQHVTREVAQDYVDRCQRRARSTEVEDLDPCDAHQRWSGDTDLGRQ